MFIVVIVTIIVVICMSYVTIMILLITSEHLDRASSYDLVLGLVRRSAPSPVGEFFMSCHTLYHVIMLPCPMSTCRHILHQFSNMLSLACIPRHLYNFNYCRLSFPLGPLAACLYNQYKNIIFSKNLTLIVNISGCRHAPSTPPPSRHHCPCHHTSRSSSSSTSP